MIAIYKRELRSYFSGIMGWLFIAFLLFFSGIFATSICLQQMSARFEYVISNMSIVFLLAVPVLTMRSLSAEKGEKTDKLLYSLPIKLSSVVLGKYFSMLTILLIATVAMGVYPVIISLFGIIDYTIAYASLIGFFLLGCALISVCMFLSSLTESTVIAAVLSFNAVLLLYIMDGAIYLLPSSALGSFVCLILLAIAISVISYFLTKSYMATVIIAAIGIIPTAIFYIVTPDSFGGLFPAIVDYLSVFKRFQYFIYGIFDLTAVVYFISFAVFFVFLTVLSLEKKRWN